MGVASIDAGLDWIASTDSYELLARGLRGIEKECLRVTPEGHLAATEHPPALGSALTHPYITTDYSEALLELVTPPRVGIESALSFLDELHAFICRRTANELLWPSSMPCIVGADESVPIAQYGPSNEGMLRSIYRSGLGFRYGRSMQAIAGIHLNFSLPAEFWPKFHAARRSGQSLQEFKSESLMGLVRNYRRLGWLVTFLFGASPVFCKSFRPHGHPRLESLSAGSWFAPHSTSLRMSDMGYRNSTQARLSVSVNSLAQYLQELATALTTPEPNYEAIGVKRNGEYRQLSANILQLENEYYSSIRPKPASKQPRLITALATAGVEYVEVRTLDLNPFAPSGVNEQQARLIELLLIRCLLLPSPPIADSEQAEIDQRELTVAWEGRKPELKLTRDGREIGLQDWAAELLDELAVIAHAFGSSHGGYRSAVESAREAVANPNRTLSAQVLAALADGKREFFDWALALARQQKAHFVAAEIAAGKLAEFDRLAVESLASAASMAAADEPDFEVFLAEFLTSGLPQPQNSGNL